MKPKRFFYLLCAALALLIVAGGGAYYLASRNLQAGTATLSQRMGDVELADSHLSSLDDLQKQQQRLQPLLPAINNALPNQKNQTLIAIQLHSIAAESGMDLNNLSFSASAAPGPISQTVPMGSVLAIPINFQLNGSYDQLQQFLNLQEHLARYTSVTSLGITADPTHGRLTFDVTLNAFMKP